jgi:UDP-N-acetyl-2-amino-2-deoxyglucuronate dehydrogenase
MQHLTLMNIEISKIDPSETIGFAIVGFGYIGRRHAEMISSNPNAKLLAICDLDNSKHSKEFQDIPFFDSVEEMLKAIRGIDVLTVATPNSSHADLALIGLSHKKHVIIEKPMALKKQDAEKIIFKALQVSKQVFCVMQNRYSPPAEWLKSILEQGLLGNVYMVSVNCYWNRDKRYYQPELWKGKLDVDGGTLFTQFSHFVDMLYWLFGDIKDIVAKFNDFNHKDLTDFEDSGMVQFNFVNGGMGNLNYSTSVWDKNMESSMIILAENGTVKIGGQYMNTVEYCHVKDYEMPELKPSNPPNYYGNYVGSASNHQQFYQNVIKALKSEETITTNALEGLKVVDMIERIYEQNPYLRKKK